MSAPTVPLPLRWRDLQAMPAGPRRDELVYAWRTRIANRRREQEREIADIDGLLAAAEAHRALAVLRWHEHPHVLADRRAQLARATRRSA